MLIRRIWNFKLAGPRGDEIHPYLNAEGAFHGGGVALLEKNEFGRWRPRPLPALERILSAGYAQPVDMSRRMQSLDAVATALNDNNPSLAAIALVQAQFPPLPDVDAAQRMREAEALEKEASLAYLRQPRIPAGSVGAGQWTTEAGGTALAARSLPYLLRLSARLAGPLGVAAGILFPDNENLESSGEVVGHPGLSYHFSEMRLTLIRHDDQGGARLLFSGMHGRDGFYRDQDGTIIGRAVGNSFMLDNDGVAAMSAAQSETSDRTSSSTATDDASDQPRLCPDPSPDRPGDKRDRNIAYERQISGLPPGMAIYFNGVHFDGCRTTDGTLLEAKGPGYDGALDEDGQWEPWYKGKEKLEEQIERQSRAAGTRLVEWHVAEPSVAQNIEKYVDTHGYTNIIVIHTPARQP